jgi:hypothetical protein
VICRCCQAEVCGGASAEAQAIVATGAYVLMVNCGCGASLAFVMMLSEPEALQRHAEERRYQEHREAMSALTEARKSGAAFSVLRRLEQREEQLSYAE